MNDSITLLLGGLGLTTEACARHLGKGEKALTPQRFGQLLKGDEEDVQRAVSAAYKAAKAAGWDDGKIFGVAKYVAPEYAGRLAIAALEGSSDPVAPYVRQLLGG